MLSVLQLALFVAERLRFPRSITYALFKRIDTMRRVQMMNKIITAASRRSDVELAVSSAAAGLSPGRYRSPRFARARAPGS